MLERIKNDPNAPQKVGAVVGGIVGLLFGLYFSERLDVMEDTNGTQTDRPEQPAVEQSDSTE